MLLNIIIFLNKIIIVSNTVLLIFHLKVLEMHLHKNVNDINVNEKNMKI